MYKKLIALIFILASLPLLGQINPQQQIKWPAGQYPFANYAGNYSGVVLDPGSNTTDSTVGLNNAIANMPSSGGTLVLQQGTYCVSGTVLVSQLSYFTLVGQGPGPSIIKVCGNGQGLSTSTPVLDFQQDNSPTISNVQVLGNVNYPALAGIRFYVPLNYSLVSTHATVTNVLVNGASALTPAFTEGIMWDHFGTTGACTTGVSGNCNNDQASVSHTTVSMVSDSDIYIRGGNSLWNNFTDVSLYYASNAFKLKGGSVNVTGAKIADLGNGVTNTGGTSGTSAIAYFDATDTSDGYFHGSTFTNINSETGLAPSGSNVVGGGAEILYAGNGATLPSITFIACECGAGTNSGSQQLWDYESAGNNGVLNIIGGTDETFNGGAMTFAGGNGTVVNITGHFTNLATINNNTVTVNLNNVTRQGGQITFTGTGLTNVIGGGESNSGTYNNAFSGYLIAGNLIDSALTAGTGVICPNGALGTFTQSGCTVAGITGWTIVGPTSANTIVGMFTPGTQNSGMDHNFYTSTFAPASGNVGNGISILKATGQSMGIALVNNSGVFYMTRFNATNITGQQQCVYTSGTELTTASQLTACHIELNPTTTDYYIYSSGAGTMTGTTTTASHTFTHSYTGTPVCTATPQSNTGNWWISSISGSAITVTYVTSGASTWDVTCSGQGGVW